MAVKRAAARNAGGQAAATAAAPPKAAPKAPAARFASTDSSASTRERPPSPGTQSRKRLARMLQRDEAGRTPPHEPDDGREMYTVTFGEGALGLSFVKRNPSAPIRVRTAKAQAAAQGVSPGDVLRSVAGEEVGPRTRVGEVTEMVTRATRPMKMEFARATSETSGSERD